MPPIKVNARDWDVEIAAQATTPSYTQIGGLNTFSLSQSDQTTDTTDFDSNGIREGEVMERGKSVSFDGFYLEDASGNRDPGQAAVETACGDAAVGPASLFLIRLTSPAGEPEEFLAHLSRNNVGGGNNDKTSWGFTATRSGGSTFS